MEVWEERACEEGMSLCKTKESGVQSRGFPLSGSTVTCGEQLCGKENKQGSERDIVMNSFFFFFSFPLNFTKDSEHQHGKLC